MKVFAGSLVFALALSCAPALAQQDASQTPEDTDQPTQGTVTEVHLDQHAHLRGTTCKPTRVSFNGKINADGPAFVTYRWLRSDGTHKDGVMQFTKADGRSVITAWDQTSTFSGWVRLIVLTPRRVETPKTYFWVHCGTS
jgi:hypothetical protein